MAEQYMWVKLIKEWGGFSVGDVIRFGWPKGEGRITAGEGVQVPKQSAINAPIVETATAKPKAETQCVNPVPPMTDKIEKAKIKAEAKAKAKKV